MDFLSASMTEEDRRQERLVNQIADAVVKRQHTPEPARATASRFGVPGSGDYWDRYTRMYARRRARTAAIHEALGPTK